MNNARLSLTRYRTHSSTPPRAMGTDLSLCMHQGPLVPPPPPICWQKPPQRPSISYLKAFLDVPLPTIFNSFTSENVPLST